MCGKSDYHFSYHNIGENQQAARQQVMQTVGRQVIFQTNETRVIMSANSTIRTRLASIRDKEFIVSLLPRLAEFGPPPGVMALKCLPPIFKC